MASLFRRLLVMLLYLPLAFSSAASAASLADLIETIRPGIVGVGSARPVKQPGAKGPPVKFSGTGFVVGEGDLVITNYHVLPQKMDTDNNETLAVFVGRGKQSRVLSAVVLRTDPQHDLALLKIDTRLPALRLGRDRNVREGDSIAFTGFPIGVVLGLHPVTHRGIISAITPTVIPAHNSRQLTPEQVKRIRNPFDVYQLDAIAYPGNSGSPVYETETGTVIGVINSVFVKETKETIMQDPSGISYAIPVKYVLKLLNAD